MSKELRKLFEKELQEYLKKKLICEANFRINRKEILIKSTKNNSADGYIGFRYLNNACGYILYTGAHSPELSYFFKSVNPPYRSNRPENVVYSMSTSMEIGFKSFGTNVYGTVDLPKNDEERSKACEWIFSKVKDIYLPRVMNLIELTSETIDDVLPTLSIMLILS